MPESSIIDVEVLDPQVTAMLDGAVEASLCAWETWKTLSAIVSRSTLGAAKNILLFDLTTQAPGRKGVLGSAVLPITIDDLVTHQPVYVVPGQNTPLLLGRLFIPQ